MKETLGSFFYWLKGKGKHVHSFLSFNISDSPISLSTYLYSMYLILSHFPHPRLCLFMFIFPFLHLSTCFLITLILPNNPPENTWSPLLERKIRTQMETSCSLGLLAIKRYNVAGKESLSLHLRGYLSSPTAAQNLTSAELFSVNSLGVFSASLAYLTSMT